MYSPWKKNKKKTVIKQKEALGPCQGPNLYILSRTPFYQFHKGHPKNTKFWLSITKNILLNFFEFLQPSNITIKIAYILVDGKLVSSSP